MTLTDEAASYAMDRATTALERDHPEASAADLFAAEHGGPEDDDSDGGEPDADGGQDEPKPRGRRARKAAEVE